MRIPRLFHPSIIASQKQIELSDDAAGHVARVLRMQVHQPIILFDGTGYEYTTTITHLSKKNVHVIVQHAAFKNAESPLNLHLGQVISRGDKMEFTIQKSVELGVNTITPLLSGRCGVKLDEKRFEKKLGQWKKIVIAACEQCGRNIIPKINPIIQLEHWCAEETNALKLNLHPRATYSIKTLPETKQNIRLLVGPEGGLSEDEILMTQKHQFEEILLGPRVLRTETAALTAITALQVRFGDLG